MILRARIAELSPESATLQIPYAGEQRALSELKAQNVTLTAEDYTAIRLSLGGGKRGRQRARELVPVECPACDCRLTHFERGGRAAYFSATDAHAAHGAQCAAVPPARTEVETARTEVPSAPAEVEACAAHAPTSHYQIGQIGQNGQIGPIGQIDDASTLRASSALPGQQALRADGLTVLAPDATRLPDARELLIHALNRALPADSVVRFQGQDYVVRAAADLHQLHDGAQVAVYGRVSAASWNQESGRLTLRAVPQTVQVWATAGVPRALLQVDESQRIEAPVLLRAVPFLAFGRLKKLGPVCGIPVFRRDCFVLLHPSALTAARPQPASASSWPPVHAPAASQFAELLQASLAREAARLHPPALESPAFEEQAEDPADDAMLSELLASVPMLPLLASSAELTATSGKPTPTRLKRAQRKSKQLARGTRDKERRASR